jgi:alpha-L-rhamnosidase
MKRMFHPAGLPTLLSCVALLVIAPRLCSVSEAASARAAKPLLTVEQLRCEGWTNPLGVDTATPRLSWRLQATHPIARGVRQSAYQILVASSAKALGQDAGGLWDSGKVSSDETFAIAYAGKPLTSSQRVFWKVRVWDQAGTPSAWSPASEWTMGLLSPDDWQGARWIALADTNAPSQLLRREFTVKPGLVRATVHVSGLGQYELNLNGAKVGADLLTPGWTDYRKTVLYDTYDVTAMLRAGINAAGLTLGNGMYSVQKTRERYNKFAGSLGTPKAIILLRLDYADGTTEFITTDARWQARSGPITYSNVYGGEDYDARLNPVGWDGAGFDAAGWSAATETAAPAGALRGLSAAGWPLRVIETLKPVAQREISPGVVVYDLSQNVPLMPRLAVRGPAGSSVKIIPSELLGEDGDIDDTMCGRKAFWTYTLAGGGREEWFPQFFYRGGRYLRVEARPAAEGGELPRVLELTGEVVHADAPAIGEFATSSDLFNRIHALVRWGQRGNLASVLTDCPHREKLGWLEQDYLNGPALRYNFDLDPLFGKIANDIHDAQLTNGFVPNIAPEYTVFGWWDDMQFRETPEWGSAFIQIPWQQYLFTGDLELVRRHYDAMERYLAYLGTRVGGDGILRIPGALGDWYDIGPKGPGRAQLTPVDLTATAIYHDNCIIMATFAAKLGHPDDAEAFREQAARTQASFNREYFRADDGHYATGSQTANAMPLALGMVPPEHRDSVLKTIVEDVRRNGLTSGDVGYRYLLRALAEGRHSEAVFAMNHQTDKPGYGMQLTKGATSLTEAWDARRRSSQNHFMLGQINEWFFHDLAGIQPNPDAPGFKNVVIQPAIVGDLTWVKGAYDSVRGRIVSEWQRDAGKLTLTVVIPPNTTGTVFVPCRNAGDVRESGRAAAKAQGVRPLLTESGCAVFEVSAGRYIFTVPQ